LQVENTKNPDEEKEGMTKDERRLLIEYLEKQGWTSAQIVDLFKYISA